MGKSVVIVGANQSALVLARLLGEKGFDVRVYEKEARKNVAYDWHDDMHPSAFAAADIPLPDKPFWFPKGDWSFVSPDEKSITRIHQDPERVDWSIERRKFNDYLYSRAESYAEFHYSSVAKRVIIESGRVVGIELESGEKVYSDLVVDISGATSACRRSLPAEFKIQRETEKGDLFRAWRAFVTRAPGVPDPEYTNKAYLKHLGEAGISWCIWDQPSDTVNLLIGRIDELSDSEFDRAYAALKKDNPIIGDTVVRGDRMCTIPVRRPISKMFADGYVLLGDSAFMTIPMLGSGMASGIRAAKILSDVLVSGGDKPFSSRNLYRYQRQFMQEMGAKFSGVEMLKNWLLNAPSDKVSFLFNEGLLSEEDLKRSCVGEIVKLTPKSIVQKGVRGAAQLPLLMALCGLLMKIDIQIRTAKNMPAEYSPDSFAAWQKKYSKAFGREI